MPRHNERARRKFYKKLTKYRIAKILGVKPQHLTKKNGYASKRGDKHMSYRIRVPADKAKETREKYDEIGLGDVEIIPVDLYGKRTAFPKGTDLKEVEDDIHEVFGH